MFFAHFPSRISLPRKGRRVGLRDVLFEACSVFTHVTACTLAGSPIATPYIGGFSHFVTSMTAPIASGRSDLAGWVSHPLVKRRLCTAHTQKSRSRFSKPASQPIQILRTGGVHIQSLAISLIRPLPEGRDWLLYGDEFDNIYATKDQP